MPTPVIPSSARRLGEGYKHVDKGCCSDISDMPYYGTGPDGKGFFCYRGTSALEGWHRYLRALMYGRTTMAPLTGMHLVIARAQRWNQKMAQERFGDKDFGTYDMDRLIELHAVDIKLNVQNSKYAEVTNPNNFQDTGEKFGILPTANLPAAAVEVVFSHENDDDAESNPIFGGESEGDDGEEDEPEDEDDAPGHAGPKFHITRSELLLNKHAGDECFSLSTPPPVTFAPQIICSRYEVCLWLHRVRDSGRMLPLLKCSP